MSGDRRRREVDGRDLLHERARALDAAADGIEAADGVLGEAMAEHAAAAARVGPARRGALEALDRLRLLAAHVRIDSASGGGA